MRKLYLDPEALSVDSFPTGREGAEAGTVQGYATLAIACANTRAPCPTGATCEVTYAISCVECSPRCTTVPL